MIGAVIVLAVAVVVLAGVIALMARTARIERETWAGERRLLVDRAIARHTGEVLALDRKPGGGSTDKPDPQLVEGLT